ncbi:MAG: DNA primase [Clostridia bacterium]|nr:DNA primase [Clostridia bacterium]
MASRFPAAWLDELRARADIVQIVSGYVPLKKNGHRYWGLCPFHGEKTASFSVDAEQQLYYCFGCKAGGSVIQFIMEIERLDFPEAVRFLADQLHMPLPQMENDPDWQRKRDQRDRLLSANREAARIFHQTLYTKEGEASLNYLKQRGLTDNVIRKFGLGAAPEKWDFLTQQLLQKGFTLEELRQVGLTVVKDEETLPDGTKRPKRAFDMFRNRAIFPIIDQYGNVLAFGGRILGEGQPKYLNTSDTPVFNKRLGVYAANLLRKERHLERVVLVEGYMDVVSLTQFGVTGVCATLGTALTNEQARLLKRFAPKVYLSYDGDSAGQHAILRGLDILEAEGIPARVLDFPDGLDPDEFIRRDGLEGFEKLPALSPATYRMRRLKDQYDLSTQEGRTEYAKACAQILKGLEPVEMENHLQQLMVQTGFSREVLMAQIGQTVPRVNEAVQKPAAAASVRRTPAADSTDDELRAQEMLISLLGTRRLPSDIISEQDFDDPLLKSLYTRLKEGDSPAALVDAFQDREDIRARVGRLLLTPPSEDTDQLIRMAEDCLSSLRRKRIERQIKTIMQNVNGMTGEEKREAMMQVQQLSAQLNQLKARRSTQL